MAGIDIKKAREKKEQRAREEAKRKNFSPTLWWKPKVGENIIRLMPPWTAEGPNAGQFWREVHIHWGVGPDEDNQRNFNCPARTPGEGGPCPVCDYVKQLRATRNSVDMELAKDIAAKPSYYSNIVDKEDPVYSEQDVAEWVESQDDKERECPFKAGDSKIQIWRYGVNLFDEILDLVAGGKDVSDLETGRDLIITRKGKGKEDTKYRLRADIDDSEFVYSGKRELSAAMSNLDERFTLAEPEEMYTQLHGEEAPARKQLDSKKKAAPKLPSVESDVDEMPDWAEPEQQEADSDGSGELPSDEEPPECFKDADVYSDEDAECVGGDKGDEVFDPCPFKDACRLAVLGPEDKKPRRRRAGKKPATNSGADDLEAEMRKRIQ